jgi:hypothetical protein
MRPSSLSRMRSPISAMRLSRVTSRKALDHRQAIPAGYGAPITAKLCFVTVCNAGPVSRLIWHRHTSKHGGFAARSNRRDDPKSGKRLSKFLQECRAIPKRRRYSAGFCIAAPIPGSLRARRCRAKRGSRLTSCKRSSI